MVFQNLLQNESHHNSMALGIIRIVCEPTGWKALKHSHVKSLEYAANILRPLKNVGYIVCFSNAVIYIASKSNTGRSIYLAYES